MIKMSEKEKVLWEKIKKLEREYNNHFDRSLDYCMDYDPTNYAKDRIDSLKKTCVALRDMIDTNTEIAFYDKLSHYNKNILY